MSRIFTFLFAILFPALLSAQIIVPNQVDSIPMSDGKKLPADVYLPNGWTSGPVILIQTPYNRQAYRYIGLPLGIATSINTSNYAIVITDWRGFYGGAQALYSGAPGHGEDGYSAVEWIASQSWSDGNVGTWGPSALGKVQFQTAKENPPHLKCICPLVAGPQFEYTEYYPNGCYRTEYVEQLDGLGFGLSPFVLAYPTHNLIWTYGAENPNFYPDSIFVPAFMIGGWYDHNVELMMEFFNALRTQSPSNVQNQHRLLMGPWVHGGHGSADVGSGSQGQLSYPMAAGWSDSLALRFFDYYLRGISNSWNTTPFVQYFRMGQNTWQTSSTWPPAGFTPVNLYFHSDTTMDALSPSSASGSLSYNYDPNDPSPTIGGPTLRADLDQGPYDQVPQVESRNDILRFTTATLTQDVVLTGNATVHLEVSSDKYDTDFCIRLCDVYPTGESMLVNDGVYRMRFRDGLNTADTSLMTPNQHYFIDIELPSTSIAFLAGHKIRVDVTSSNYPRFNRNMNTGGAMYPGTNGDTLVNPQIANNTIYTNSAYASYISLPVISWPNAVAENTNVSPEWTAFPNPANEFIGVNVPDGGEYTLSLFDLSGRKVLEQTANGNYTLLPLNEIGEGVYLLQLQDAKGVSVRKVVISR